jgi:hypothetical protein
MSTFIAIPHSKVALIHRVEGSATEHTKKSALYVREGVCYAHSGNDYLLLKRWHNQTSDKTWKWSYVEIDGNTGDLDYEDGHMIYKERDTTPIERKEVII